MGNRKMQRANMRSAEKMQRCIDAKMHRCAFCFLLFTFYFLLSVSPSYALPWNNKRLPAINSQQKIGYVNINWWDNFSDSCLKYYVALAIENNHDAREASWKVEEYKQFVKLQFSQELPSLSVGGAYLLGHYPDTIKGIKSNIFAVPFIAGYEADIFLKNHDKTKSSKKAYCASKFQEQSIYISLASDVATTYINILKFDKQIQLQQKLIKVKCEELLREQAKYNRGVISIPNLNKAKQDYISAKSNLDELIKSRDKSLNELAVLTGDSPANICALKRGRLDNLEYKTQIPSEISSDVVFSRPDILAAEANLEKAKIDVRVARKEFLPTISLNGIYSLDNIGPDGFGTWGSTIAAALARASLDLFKGGYKVANLKINKSRYEQMFEAYQQTDLNALKEVQNSLLLIREDSKIDQNTSKNLRTQKDNYQRAIMSYKNGVISCPNLLSESEKFIAMEQNQVNTKSARLVDYITLYKSVGGKL